MFRAVLLSLALVLCVSLMGCSGVGVPVGSADLGSQSFKQVGCEESSATSSKLVPETSRLEIPKVNFNTLKSGLGTGISGKLEAQVASAGEKFHFAIRSSCEGSQSVESLKDYGDVILTSQPSNQRFLFGQLILSGPYPYTELKQAWQKIGCLETIETSKSFELAALPSDQLFDRQDYLEIIGFHASYPIWQERMQRLNEDIIVAVIDSGVDLDHSDLIGNIWTNSGEVPGDGIDNDNNGLIDDINGYNFEARNGDPDPADGDPFDNYHGTAVAGLIAAAANGSGLVGVSPFGTKIMSLNVFADQNVASPDNIAAAIVYATNLGAKVINMSLTGAADSSVLLLAIENAIANGATVVSAAGNFGARISGSEEFTPGSYASDQEGAINVGALNTRDNSLALFSNRSSDFVEIAAPGSYAYSLALRRGIATLQVEDGYTESSGTSFAAPLVSGAAALVYGLYNDRYGQFPSAAEVENLIKSSGTPYKHLSGDVEGCKTLNILNLVNSI